MRRKKILTCLFWTSIACIVLSLLALLALKLLHVRGAAACAYAIGAALLTGGILLIVSGIGLVRGDPSNNWVRKLHFHLLDLLVLGLMAGVLGTVLLIGGALR